MTTRYCHVCRRTFGALKWCPSDEVALAPLPDEYPRPGTVIDGRWQLLAPVAQGGMSRIYRAQSLQRGIPVAVKILDPRIALRPHTTERFYREARISNLLEHANVVLNYDMGLTAEGHHAIVMEFLGGETVGHLLAREGRIPWQRAAHIAFEVGEALGHAHGRRFVHRDLKPDNVHLMGDPGPDERVKLLDFGVAYVAADREWSGPAPGSTGVSGTPAYMSPEQIRGLPLDGRSDLYSLGVLLFEMVAGRRPFPGNDPVQVCRHHLFTAPPSLLTELPEGLEVPPAFAALVRQLLSKSRDGRPPGVGAVLEKLKLVLPRERWPTRLQRRRPVSSVSRLSSSSQPVRRPTSIHGLPAASQLGDLASGNVALLHAAVSEQREEGFLGSEPPKELMDVLHEWRCLVEEGRGLVQQPEPRALRAYYGLLGGDGGSPDTALRAVRHAELLRMMLGEFTKAHALPVDLRAGVVLRSIRPGRVDPERPPFLDQDAEIAYYLAEAAPAGGILVDSSAAYALEGAGDLTTLPPVHGLALKGPERAWLVTRILG